MDKWSDLRVSTKVTGFHTICTDYHDNLFVSALGADWAVLRHSSDSKVVVCVLEPTDSFHIGEQVEDDDGSLVIVRHKDTFYT